MLYIMRLISHLKSPARQGKSAWLALGWVTVMFMHGGLACAQAYQLTRYNTENGLPEGYVYALTRDNRGFLYLGTGAGMFRFDGSTFSNFTTADGLADDFITTSIKDSKGRIWLGHEGRLSIMTGSSFLAHPDTQSIKSRVVALAEDSFGDVWCASQRNGLFCLDTASVILNFRKGLDETHVIHSMASGKANGNDYILVGTDQGLLVYVVEAKRKLRFAYAATKVPSTKVQCIAQQAKESGFWVGTEDEGLIAFTPALDDASTAVLRFDPSTGYAARNVTAIFEDPNRNLWVGSNGQGFFKFRNGLPHGKLQPILASKPTDTIGEEIIKAIFQDEFGQTWMGTYGNGLLCLSDQVLSTYRLRADSSTKLELLCSFEDSKGDFWVGTNRGIYVLDRDIVASSDMRYALSGIMTLPHKRYYGLKDGLPSEQINCMVEDQYHNVWIGTRTAGVAVLMTGAKSFEVKSFSEFSLSNNINHLSTDKQGRLWIATSDGAFSYEITTGKTNYYGTQNKLPHNNIYSIFTDRKGKVWFATHTNRIAVFDGKNIETIEVTDHGEIPNVTCMGQDKAGTYWLGTDGSGLYRYDGTVFKQYTKSDGMQSNYVYHLVIDHYGHVWTTHRDGFSRFVPDTEWFLTYPAKAYLPREENPPSSASIDVFGNLWFCTEHGAMRYNWNPTRNRGSAPYTLIESVSVFDSLYGATNELILPYNAYRVTIRYLGLTFLNQDDVQYQYKLEGREPDWSPLTKQTQVSFQALKDGDYTFHVRACNRYGKCNESSAKVRITISPPFWKTWWFRALIVLAVGGLVFAYIRYRIYRLNREKADLEEKVRQRTAELQLEKDKVERANIELEKLSLVASETDNAVFILDADGKLTWVNEGFTRLTGFKLEELLSNRSELASLKNSSDPLIRQMLETALSENRSVQYETKLPSKSGQDIWVVSTLTPILDQAGKVRNIVIIDSDITDRKIAEERIRQMNAELESLVAARTRELADAYTSLQVENEEHIKTAELLRVINSELDTFVYRASHDLKGPLASLMGLVNIAGMELSDNPVASRYLGLMDKASKRLDGILIDLIEATQVKQRTVELLEIHALSFSKTVVENLRNQLDFTKVEVSYAIDSSLNLLSDETLLTSILQNFVTNAVKYRDPAKEIATVRLSITQEDGQVTIAVSDNGIGISDEAKHRVFEMFFRGSNQTAGSGLGLYIVKQATEKLGGHVDMESEQGEGTTMFAHLPVQQART